MRLPIAGGSVEAAWWGPGPADAPTIILLHEGLGCVGLWRDVPALLARRTGLGVFAWSRLGYGQSDPAVLPRPITYLEDEAREPLTRVLAAAGVQRAVLVGHSDGGSIAAVHAGLVPRREAVAERMHTPGGGVHAGQVSRGEAASVLLGLVTIAAHYFVEELNITSIRQIKAAYETGDLRARLARWHRDPDTAFYGWNDAWLDPRFRGLDLTGYLSRIAVPVLGLQGADDPYGTEAQLHVMERHINAPLTTRLIPGARHSPHLEAKEATLDAIVRFIQEVLP